MLVNPASAVGADNGNDNNTKSDYEQMLWKMQYDSRWLKEVSFGKRVGFYRFSENIGSGNFSQVKLATHLLTRDKVAVKIIDKTKLEVKTRKMISQEIKSMEAIHHPNIIRLLEVVDTYRSLHLVLEYAPGGQVYMLVSNSGALPSSRASLYFLQVTQAVRHMHRLGFVHRDIKAENVFLSNYNTIKLGDFGFSAHLQEGPNQKLNTFCGSPPYAAPELFCDDNYQGQPVDVWALGVLLYFLLTATLPFRGACVSELKKSILAGKYDIPPHIDPNARYIIENALVQKAADRITLPEILSNEWFEKPKSNPASIRKNSLMLLAKKFRRSRDPFTEVRRKSLLREFELKRIPEIIRNNKTNDISSIPMRSHDDDTDSATNTVYPLRRNVSKGKSFDTASLPSTRPDRMLHARDGEASELGRFVMFPTAVSDLQQVSLLERTARERLARLGISSSLLLDHLAHGSRSPIIGIYRCVVNHIIEEQYMWESLNDPAVLIQMSRGEQPPSPSNKCFRSKLTKICAIL